jgi:hypothetical protein
VETLEDMRAVWEVARSNCPPLPEWTQKCGIINHLATLVSLLFTARGSSFIIFSTPTHIHTYFT